MLYEGIWHGKTVRFEREFRGYHFSDEECDALCRGEILAVHGVKRGSVQYSVAGCLQDSMFGNVSDGLPSVRFKVLNTISFDPSYRFATRVVSYAPDAKKPTVDIENSVKPKEDVYLPSDDALPLDSDVMRDMMEMDAKMSAMISSDALPEVVKVSSEGEPPHFVPIFTLLSVQQIDAAVKRALVEMRAGA